MATTKKTRVNEKNSAAAALPEMDNETRRIMAAIANRLWKQAEAKAKADTERTAASIVAILDRLGLSIDHGLAIIQALAAGKTPAQVPVMPSLVANRLDRMVDAAAAPAEQKYGQLK